MANVEELFGKLEGELKSFVGRHSKANAEQDCRLRAIEQKLTAPSLGGSEYLPESKSTGPAPKDQKTGLPILNKSHRLAENLPPGEVRGLDAGKYLRGLITNDWAGAPEERKTFSELSGASGGYTLPLEVSAQFIDFARNASACVRAGAVTYPMTQSTLRIPVLAQDLVSSWKLELADIQDVGGLIDKHDATPHTLAGSALVSVELFEDAPALVSFLQSAWGRSMGQQLDFAGLKGAETYGPVGLLNNGAVHQTPGSGPLTYDQISLAIQAIRDRNFEPNSYVVGPEGSGELARTRAVPTGNYLNPPEDVAQLNQFRTVSADNDVYVGDWSWLWFLPRTSINMEVSRVGDGSAWKKLGVALRAYLRADVVCVNPNAFQIITNFGS
jgi:HK97 family phage major capsid protein